MRAGGRQPRTIYNWIASGKVEYVRTAGGSVRIFVDTLWREPGTDVPDLTRKKLLMPAPWSPRRRGRIPDLGLLFHRLNNQLGIILANAELLEAKSADEMSRARASRWSRACSMRWAPRKRSALRTRLPCTAGLS